MKELNMQELASAVLAWMVHESLCGRSRVTCERTLAYPIYGHVFGHRLFVRAEEPLPGNPQARVDFAFADGEDKPPTGWMETKLNSTRKCIASDLVRLAQLHGRRYFLYAQLDAVMETKKELSPMLSVPKPEKESARDSIAAAVTSSERTPRLVKPDKKEDSDYFDGNLQKEFWTKLVGFDQHPLLEPTAMVAIWEVGVND
ncbi:hypothetical protein FJY70_00630 [candidate division WOR-3 bacterium]|nr:hypothetical protein [candidate division WOR-3 bacterium]